MHGGGSTTQHNMRWTPPARQMGELAAQTAELAADLSPPGSCSSPPLAASIWPTSLPAADHAYPLHLAMMVQSARRHLQGPSIVHAGLPAVVENATRLDTTMALADCEPAFAMQLHLEGARLPPRLPCCWRTSPCYFPLSHLRWDPRAQPPAHPSDEGRRVARRDQLPLAEHRVHGHHRPAKDSWGGGGI